MYTSYKSATALEPFVGIRRHVLFPMLQLFFRSYNNMLYISSMLDARNVQNVLLTKKKQSENTESKNQENVDYSKKPKA